MSKFSINSDTFIECNNKNDFAEKIIKFNKETVVADKIFRVADFYLDTLQQRIGLFLFDFEKTTIDINGKISNGNPINLKIFYFPYKLNIAEDETLYNIVLNFGNKIVENLMLECSKIENNEY